MRAYVKLICMCALIGIAAHAQDSVDVTFRYNVQGFPTGLSVPGEFNNWSRTAWPMTYRGGTLWTRDARLRIGGMPGGGIPGAYQYKFYYTGVTTWPNDPLNHHVNPSDNDNSFIIVKDPTIYHFLPNQRTGPVNTNRPTITAYIFPRVGTTFDTSQLALTINGTTITGIGSSYNFTTKQMSYTVSTPLANGQHTVILRAGATLDTVRFILHVGGPTIAAMPSYAKHGVTLPSAASNDSTTFRLRVGGTSFVALYIAPAGQPLTGVQPVFMRKNPTTDDYWLNVYLPLGTYEYQYQTASGQMLNDPWGRYNGTYGTRFTIGPEGLTADDYVWGSTNYVRPPLNRLIIYQLHVGEFAGGYYGLGGGQAGFTHLTTLLPYLDSLGVNAVQLMPITDYGLIGRSAHHSWGYDVAHHFAIEPAYGTPRQFKAFVDSAHARGIAVILDVVFNHLNDTGPLWQMQPDLAGNPYFKDCNDLRFNEDYMCLFRDVDHWTTETQELVYTALKMWIDEYRVDGFRYDYTQGIGWNVNEPTKGILGWANRIHQEYQGQIYQIVEHLPESPALIYHSGITSGWHDSFRDEMFDEARFRNRSLYNIEELVLDLGAYAGNDIPSTPARYGARIEPVNHTNNHDEQSVLYEMITFQGVPLNEALLRDKLYGALVFTSLGVPMLWQGQEFSAPRGWIDANQRLSYRPLEWNIYRTPRGQGHIAWYKKLIFQRKRNPALYNGILRRLYRYDAQKTLVWGFEDIATSARVVGVANFTPTNQTITNIPWVGSGTFYNIVDQSTLVVSVGSVPSVNVPAYTALLFSSLPDSVLLTVQQESFEPPASFALMQNYPNPFNPSTKIRFTVPSSQFTVLKVFDVLGREVATLVNGELKPGSYEATFDASDLPSGVYFYRLTAGSFVQTRKLVMVK